jgi:hypothetical protein
LHPLLRAKSKNGCSKWKGKRRKERKRGFSLFVFEINSIGPINELQRAAISLRFYIIIEREGETRCP